MMIKKKLGLMAASVLVASGAVSSANAAISAQSETLDPGNGTTAYKEWEGVDSSVVFWANDSSDTNGTFFANLTALAGVTVDSLFDGTGFSYDLSTALSAAGVSLASYDQWGIAASSNQLGTTYGYQKAGEEMGAFITNSGTPIAGVGGAENIAENIQNEITNWFTQIVGELGGADSGAVGAGSSADWNGTASRTVAPTTNGTAFGSVADLYFHGIRDLTPEPNFSGTSIATSQVIMRDELTTVTSVSRMFGGVAGNTVAFSAIPVPAAAWLFGSALLGLGAIRRK